MEDRNRILHSIHQDFKKNDDIANVGDLISISVKTMKNKIEGILISKNSNLYTRKIKVFNPKTKSVYDIFCNHSNVTISVIKRETVRARRAKLYYLTRK